MKKVVKNSIEWTIITIALCILVVVLAATREIVTNSNQHSFFQMISDSLPKDSNDLANLCRNVLNSYLVKKI